MVIFFVYTIFPHANFNLSSAVTRHKQSIIDGNTPYFIDPGEMTSHCPQEEILTRCNAILAEANFCARLYLANIIKIGLHSNLSNELYYALPILIPEQRCDNSLNNNGLL